MNEHDTRQPRTTTPPPHGEPADASYDELLLAANAAKRFYLDQASKVEIAQELGLSRFKVARLLELAHARGIVRIDIAFPSDVDTGLSQALREQFKLTHAIVVNTSRHDTGGPEPFTDLLAPAAARLISDLMDEQDILGLAWGRAVTAVSHAFTRLPPCPVVQLTGVHPPTAITEEAVQAVHHTAALSGGTAYPLYAPLVLPNDLTAYVLRHQPTIARSLGMFRSVTTAVLAIGAWGPELSTVHEALTESEREHYRALGVVAEMSSLLFDSDGNLVSTGLSERVIAVRAEELRHVRRVIAVAGGREKAPAVRAVLKSGLLTGIVTDAATARTVLREPRSALPPPEDSRGG